MMFSTQHLLNSPFSHPQSPIFFDSPDSPVSQCVDDDLKCCVTVGPTEYLAQNFQQMPPEQLLCFLGFHFQHILEDSDEELCFKFLSFPPFCDALDRLFFYEKEPFFQFIDKYTQFQLLCFSPIFKNSISKIFYMGARRLRHYLHHPTVAQFICYLSDKELLNIYKTFKGFWWKFPNNRSRSLIDLFKIVSKNSPSIDDCKLRFELAFFQLDSSIQKDILTHPDLGPQIHSLFDQQHDRLLRHMQFDEQDLSDPTTQPLFAFQPLATQTRSLCAMIFEGYRISSADKQLLEHTLSLSVIPPEKIPFFVVQRPDLFPTTKNQMEQITVRALHRILPEAVQEILFAPRQALDASMVEEKLNGLAAKALEKIDPKKPNWDAMLKLPIGQFMGLCIQVPGLMDPFIPSPTLHGMIARRVDAFLEKQFAHHRWHMVDFILKLSKIG